MSDAFPAPAPPSLPTFANLGASPPKDPDVRAIGTDWLTGFATAVDSREVHRLVSSFLLADPWWRDVFALTWDLRTFYGRAKVETFLNDRLAEAGFGNVAFADAIYQPAGVDLAWILVHFTFETTVALGKGVARLVYCPDDSWRAVTVSTHLDALKGHPELTSADRDPRINQGDWAERRRKELEFADKDPEVLVIGGGQAGLQTAARLKHHKVSHLIIEKNARIGDNWRARYDSLTLHDPIWSNHMAYLPFPVSWPVFPSAKKLADWLEFYAEALELNVWFSSEAISAVRNENTNKWDVVVRRADGLERTMHVDHIVLAHGFLFKKTVFPGQDDFKGQLLHSSEFKTAKGLEGKKVIIVGACSSGHDIASDCADEGVDVTIIQRSSTCVMSLEKGVLTTLSRAVWEKGTLEEVDNHWVSTPFHFTKPLTQRVMAYIRGLDKELLDGLDKVGYRLNNGPDDTGVAYSFAERGGGYYIDTGAGQKIIDGKIKVKSGSEVARITETSVVFEDGSELPADVVVVATGFDDARAPIRKLVGEDVGARIPPIWGLNEEREPRAVWREIEGLPNMWIMMGNIFLSRYFSKSVALQIKAKQEGLYGTRYAALAS
ncbi:uncharacterized protein PHACADRAFT_153015 [Phanerochaete carnosa HHB-10118-sp]|uniref:FAD/NAD(P)-binding domain-containing protein n=1 Tax=Phanerochaete carnosa (strain HHB-10118-sp) TaxID=650164 RepID=K5UM29_PHACS|nr:uncharacterized protein PHACADRAFT_153015 [Phanerochaete carnosa HHB-10118-sp]EKM50761.1 hypothetical protein PHACADRAFT_153015 [Phanerochaete carnosa HHB-10118-sp]